MTVVVYTDASYCERSDIAACGYVILVDGKMKKHDILFVRGLKKPSNAEIFSIVQALQYSFLINGVKSITVNTDHKPTVTRRKKKLIFKELDDTVELIREYSISVQFFHVKGHSNNYYNNLVDESCNQNLKSFLKNTNNAKNFTGRINHNGPVRL